MSALGKEAKMGILPRKVLQSDKSTLDRPKLLKIIGIENCGRHEGKIFAIFEFGVEKESSAANGSERQLSMLFCKPRIERYKSAI